jgi:hypothetical protein
VTEWERTRKRYDIRFDIHAKEPPFFLVANAAIRKARGDRYVQLCRLLVLDTDKKSDQQELENLAKEIKVQGWCDAMDAMEVYTTLDRVRKIRDKDIVTISVDHELEDVVEIFSRLNSKGTRVTEADIYLGIVASRAPGWVKGTFLPRLKLLREAGFDVTPNLLFRTVTGVGVKKVRFREIPDDFWNEGKVQPAWNGATRAWEALIGRFREYGVLSNDPLPTEAALVTMVALLDKFPAGSFAHAFYWFLQASRFGRYSGSGTTSLEEDLREISEGKDLDTALAGLLRRFHHTEPIEPEEFLRDYADARFGRFLLYLLVYRNKAMDWAQEPTRLGFEGLEVLAAFRPQWHHVFPKKFLEGKVNHGLVDALANIAVIGPTINIRISSREPMDYVRRYAISQEKLTQQFIDDDITSIPVTNYEGWLHSRAASLARAANEFLAELKGDL